MSTPEVAGVELDPVIHVPARLKLVVSLAALPSGDTLTFARLQSMHGLTAGNLITHLRRLEDAGYVTTHKGAKATSVRLTTQGRAALEQYRAALAAILGG